MIPLQEILDRLYELEALVMSRPIPQDIKDAIYHWTGGLRERVKEVEFENRDAADGD